MSKIKKTICAVGLVVAGVLGTYSTDPTFLSKQGNQLRFSKAAMDIIGDAEGCRRDPYKCPADIWTAGVGHTQDVTPGQMYSLETITKWFARDLMDTQNCLETFVEKRLGKQLPQSVFDGIGSYTFNVGCMKMRSSTLYQLLLQGQFAEACRQLPRWVYAGKTKLPGLVTRRDKEMALCLKDAA